MAYVPQWVSEIVSLLVILPKHLLDNFTAIESEFLKFKPAQVGAFFTGFSLPVTASTNSFAFPVPYNCTITDYYVLTDQTGSCTINIEKSTFTAWNGLTTTFTDITGGNNIVLTSQNKKTDSALTGWSRDLTAGDLIRFNVAANSNNTRMTVYLKLRRIT